MDAKKTVFFNIRFDPQMHRSLKRQARKNERTLAGEIRFALAEYLERLEAAA